jgi:hypothetical protein
VYFKKSEMDKIRALLGRLILRGGIFRVWVRWKTGRLVQLYKSLLLRSCRANGPINSARPVASGNPLQKILFLTDNMWEQRELLPELSRICEVIFIDVHQLIQHDRDGREFLPAGEIIAKLAEFKKISFDCAMVYLRSTLLSDELLHFVRTSWPCPLVGLNLDCKTTFDDYGVFRREPTGYQAWTKRFDCNITNAKAMVDVYAGIGANCLYVPTAYHYDPKIHKAPDGSPFEFELSFVGSCKPERVQVIDELRRKGIDVKVFGGGWGGQSFAKEGWRVFQKTQLNLGIGFNVSDTRITNLKNRDFECPGAGGCYLTTYDWELAGLYDIGKEIICYRGTDDLIELYSYYVRRPDECRRIAVAGFERCRREHTWEHRFRKVFDELGFKPQMKLLERS